MASALLVTGCTGDLAGGGADASLPARVASGTVLAVDIHEAIICVAVEKPTADLAGGCYDLGIRTDVRRGDEVRIQVVEDKSNDANGRDEVVAIEVRRAA
jgi:hypothetical protein